MHLHRLVTRLLLGLPSAALNRIRPHPSRSFLSCPSVEIASHIAMSLDPSLTRRSLASHKEDEIDLTVCKGKKGQSGKNDIYVREDERW
jgi:hypothetical protein